MKQKEAYDNMKKQLTHQLGEKKVKEGLEKDQQLEQAHMWQIDRENYSKIENSNKSKLDMMKKEYAQFQLKQVQEHIDNKRGMDMREYQINKKLLSDIRGKDGSAISQSQY